MATWSGDLAEEGFDHYSDNIAGTPNNVSDDNLNLVADANIQNFTYVSMDFGAGNAKQISRIRLYFSNSFGFTNVVGNGTLRASNNSTNGVDGDWTDLLVLTGNLSAPGAYPGWTDYAVFENETPYRWYGINDTPAAANTVLFEWELEEDLDVTEASSILQGTSLINMGLL